jgi:hypothetical protein
VLRFIKTLGYHNFTNFKDELAGREQKEHSKFLYGFPKSSQDRIRDVPAKIIATTIGQIKGSIRSMPVAYRLSGDSGIRTHDLLDAIQVLSQYLSSVNI